MSYGLDFDDAYQYILAVQHELPIISFDADFDRTPLGRQSPDELEQVKDKNPFLKNNA